MEEYQGTQESINNECADASESNNEEINKFQFNTDMEVISKESIFKFKYSIPLFVMIVLVFFAMVIISFNNYTAVKEANNKIIELSSKVENMESSLIEVQGIKADVEIIGISLYELEKSSYLTQLSLEVSEGVVTEKAVIQKANLYALGDVLYGYIDLRAQPSYSSYFQGQGKFNLSDRELRTMIEEVVVELEDFIAPMSTYNITMDGGIISITANNYSVAEYKGGVVILAGE